MSQIVCNQNTRIASLYTLRFICVFLIIAIHFPIAGTTLLIPLLRTGVPIFFMTSGYFCYHQQREVVSDRVHRTFRKVIWITLYANVIFGTLKILMFTVGTGDPLPLHTLSGWLRLFFVGNTILEYLWYMTAYLESLVIFYLFLKLKCEYILTWLTPLLLLTGLLLGKYCFLMGVSESPALYISRNFLTLGLPFFYIGYLLHRFEMPLITRFGRTIIAYCILFMLAVLIEGYLLHTVFRLGDIFIFTAPLAVSIFILCLKHKQLGDTSWICRMGKEHALNIYLFQSIIAGVIASIGHYFLKMDVLPYAAPAIFLGSLLFSIIINHTHHLLRKEQ